MESDNDKLMQILKKQLNNFWDISIVDEAWFLEKITSAMNKVNISYLASNNKYYLKTGFSAFHSSMYSIFLYFLANLIGKEVNTTQLSDERRHLPDALYYLNKIMNGVDWYWEIELPKLFIAEHPVGTVLGRAAYSDYLCVYQGVTIGGNRGRFSDAFHRGDAGEGEVFYPELKEFVILYAHASVIGKCSIGKRVIVAANTVIKDENIPDNTIVFGSSPHLSLKTYDKDFNFQDKK